MDVFTWALLQDSVTITPKNNFIRIGSFTGKISDIIEDYFGRIWIGTSISGLYSYNVRTQKITSYQRSDHPNSLTKNVITILAIDSKNSYGWERMAKGFADIMMKRTISPRYDHLKLPNKIINSIIPKGDLLWISTNKGLCCIQPGHETYKTYSKSNGLYNEQFTPCSGFESSDGRLFLGSTDGFCYFFPQDLRENTYNPPVILTNMTIFEKTYRLTRPIHLFTSP